MNRNEPGSYKMKKEKEKRKKEKENETENPRRTQLNRQIIM